MKVKELNKLDNRELTPPYARYLVHLIRPFPNFDWFFIKSLRQTREFVYIVLRNYRFYRDLYPEQ